MGNQPAALDLKIARIAARQHGVATTAQLAAAGIDKWAVLRRARGGGCIAYTVVSMPSGIRD
ncbi:MAG: type IV toxin-antitoxin system AbiEi family antitoxin domain-containing protein [Solirubrobacterales bacterium]